MELVLSLAVQCLCVLARDCGDEVVLCPGRRDCLCDVKRIGQ